MNDDEIEVLDFDDTKELNFTKELKLEMLDNMRFEEKKYTEDNEKIYENSNKKHNSKIKSLRKKNKKGKKNNNDNLEKSNETQSRKKKINVQLIFCMISILFIIGCFIFYGSRLIKYYKIYNPEPIKGEAVSLMSQSIINNTGISTEDDGLYKVGNSYIYRGIKVDNYVKYNNILWRIIKINEDGSLDIISDQILNSLSFNKTKISYEKSNINKYLNDYIMKYIDKDYLTKITYCKDEVDDVNNISCNDTNLVYMRLISIAEFMNSKTENGSFINKEDALWTYNENSKGAWAIDEENITNAKFDLIYGIKPVVKLKNSTTLIKGKGTSKNPYIIEKDNNTLEVGNYIQLNDDLWMIYDINNDSLRLVKDTKLKTQYRFDLKNNIYNSNNEYSLAEYLNNEYYSELSYKDILIDTKWYNGKYDGDYENIFKDNSINKVGLLNVSDIKLINSDSPYYLITPEDNGYVYIYQNDLIPSKVTLSRNIYPTISIKKSKIKSGKGSKTNPYILGEANEKEED